MTTPPPGYPPPYGEQPHYGGPPPYQPQWGPPQYPPYGPQYGSAPFPEPSKTNWWAVVSLVSGILGGVLISVVCGIVALNKTKDGRQSGRGMAIAGLVLSGLWVLLVVAASAVYLILGRDSVNAMDVTVGDCVAEVPESSLVFDVPVVGCEEPHRGEVYALLTMPDGDFPGHEAIAQFQYKCGPALAGYSPTAMANPAVGIFVLYPTAQSWELGDRTVTCIATSQTTRTGSIRAN
jgi:uncharacterized protein DUF4190/putative regulator of septum formation